jgi:hypothetical protein
VITQVVVSTARSSGTLVTGSVMLALVAMTAVHPAHAVTPQQLMGNWALQNAANCRYGPGGEYQITATQSE